MHGFRLHKLAVEEVRGGHEGEDELPGQGQDVHGLGNDAYHMIRTRAAMPYVDCLSLRGFVFHMGACLFKLVLWADR